jgi:cytoskeleton protein RodZ
MGGFGERLRREREKRGISLEEIAGSTKIGTRSLRALEDDAFDSLPGGIFDRGFVRAYARALGMDEEQCVADFTVAYDAYVAANKPVIVVPAEAESESRISWPLIGSLALAVALASGWFAWKSYKAHDSNIPPSSEVETAPSIAREPSAREPSSAATTPVAQSAETAKLQSTEVRNSVSEASSSQPPTKQLGAEKLNALKSSASPPIPTPPGKQAPIRLELFAREESWISVLADGKSLGQGVLAAQKHKSIAAQKEIRVKLGNVAGVEVSFNGQQVNIDGQPKQVRELTFTVDGLQQ